MIPAFGHHYLPLLSSPEAAGTLGGKAHLAAVKEACKSAGRINGALTLAGRFELAVVSDIIDFFDPAPGMAKARNHAWELIRNSPRLQWVILTRHPEFFQRRYPQPGSEKAFRISALVSLPTVPTDSQKSSKPFGKLPCSAA